MPNILADLDTLTETEDEQDGKRFLLRSPPRPAASLDCAPLASPRRPPRASSATPDPKPSINENLVPRCFSSADLRFQSMLWQFVV
jgi:hypothetical protein